MSRVTSALQGPVALDQQWRSECTGPVAKLALSPNGLWIAAATVDGPIAILDVATGAIMSALAGHSFGTTTVDWHPDSINVATGGQDGLACLWDVRNGRCLLEVAVGSPWVERVAFAPDGRSLVTAAGRVLRSWATDGQLQTEWPSRSSTILDVQWRPANAGAPLFAATSYGGVGIYQPREPKKSQRELNWTGSSLTIAWSPNAKYLATGDQDSSVHFWIMRSGEDLQMTGYPRKVRELAWDRTSRYLATGGGSIPCVWDCSAKGPAGTEPLMLELHGDNVTALRYANNSGLLVSGAADGTIGIWLPADDVVPRATGACSTPVTDVTWSADDAGIIVASEDGSVARYEPML